MKCNIKVVPIILLFSVFILLISYGGQKDKWRGKIEYENGVKVIKNPNEPLCGEITFELEEDLSIGREDDENYMFYRATGLAVDSQANIYVLDSRNYRIQKFDNKGKYLQTIGRRGQGPGEFMGPSRFRIEGITENIFVLDFRSIKIFDNEGNYIRDIRLSKGLSDFFLAGEENILGRFSTTDEKRRSISIISVFNSKGKTIKKIADFPEGFPVIDGMIYKAPHGYLSWPFISELNAQTFVYGYSSDYELNIIDETGNLLYKIRKDAPPQSLKKKEKDYIREIFPKEIQNRVPLPSYRPFFSSILSDGERIYVTAFKSPLEQSKEMKFDIFSKEGYFLYNTTLSFIPRIIKNGYVYTIISSEETGQVFVKRYKIKNWDRIKKGI